MDIINFVAGDSLIRSWQLGSGTVKAFAPVDLTGCVAGWGMLPAAPTGSTVQIVSTDAEAEIAITNAPQGMVSLNMPPATTRPIVPGLYSCALKLQFADGSTQTVYFESIRVCQQISDV